MANEETYTIRLKADADELKTALREAGVSSVKDLGKIGQEARKAKEETERFVNESSNGLRRTKGSAKDTATGWRASLTEMREQLTKTARGALDFVGKITRPLRTVVAPLVAIAASVVSVNSAFATARDAGDFQQALAEVSTIADDTTFSLASTRAEILDLAVATGQLPVDTAKAFYQTLSAGFTDSADASLVLARGAELAVAGLAQTDQTVDLLTSTLNAYNISVEESARLSDLFFAAVRVGKTTIPELGASFGQVLPIASALGVSLEDLLGAIAALTVRGVATPEAVTQLRALLKTLLSEGDAVDKVLQRVGGSYDLNSVRARGLLPVLSQLRGALADESEALEVLGGRVEATSALFGLSGDAADGYQSALNALAQSSGATSDALGKISGTDAFKLRQAIGALKAEALTFGDALLAATARVIDDLGGVDTLRERFRIFFESLSPAVEGAGETIGRALSRFELLGTDIDLARLKLLELGQDGGAVFSRIAEAVSFAADTIRTMSELLDTIAPSRATRERRFLESAAQGRFSVGQQFGQDLSANAPAAFQPQLDQIRGLQSVADTTTTFGVREAALRDIARIQDDIKVRAREILGLENEQAAASARAAEAAALRSAEERKRLEDLRRALEIQATGQFVGPPAPAGGGGQAASLAGTLPASLGSGGIASDPLTAAIDQRNLLLAESTKELETQANFEAVLLGLRQRQLGFMEDGVAREAEAIELVRLRADLEAQALDAQVEAGKLSADQAARLKEALEALKSDEIRAVRESLKETAAEAASLYDTLSEAALRRSSNAVGDWAAAWVTSSDRAKLSFRDFAQSVLADIARILAQRALLSLLNFGSGGGGGGGGSGGGSTGGTIGGGVTEAAALATGGIMFGGMSKPLPVRNYAYGGIARQPQVAIFGEVPGKAEAFVPLPDNRSIPVRFEGGAGGGGGSGAPSMPPIVFAPQLLDTRTLAERLPELADDFAKLVDELLRTRSSLRSRVRSLGGGR